MKNVLFISHIANLSGAPLVLLNLLQEIKQKYPQNNLYVMQIHGGPNIKDFLKYSDVYTCEHGDNNREYKFLPYRIRKKIDQWRYKRWITRPKFELIYANTIESLKKAIEIKHQIGTPIIAHIHEAEYSFRLYGITREMLNQCDSFIAVSSIVVKALNDYGVDNNKIRIIRPFSENLFHIKNIDTTFRISDIEENTFVIGLSGYGSWRKGTDIFPLIVKNFITQHSTIPCKFIWVGYTDDKEMEYEINKLEIGNYIIRTGIVGNPLDYYNRFNIFLLTSREDPFPLVCMECAALRKPIILFEKASGIADMIKNEESGLIVPYLDIQAMSDAIYRLYENKELRKKLGDNAYNALRNNFNEEKSLKELIKIIE